MADTIRIILKIAGREYPLNIDRKVEEKYRRAAKEVNEIVTLYTKSYSADFENYLAMTALQLALVNINNESKSSLGPVVEELKRLEEELDKLDGEK